MILSIVYRGKGTHHHCKVEPNGTMTVNGKPTPAHNLDELCMFLQKKQPWWPVPLVEGVRV